MIRCPVNLQNSLKDASHSQRCQSRVVQAARQDVRPLPARVSLQEGIGRKAAKEREKESENEIVGIDLMAEQLMDGGKERRPNSRVQKAVPCFD